jgi:hypothetical protein
MGAGLQRSRQHYSKSADQLKLNEAAMRKMEA